MQRLQDVLMRAELEVDEIHTTQLLLGARWGVGVNHQHLPEQTNKMGWFGFWSVVLEILLGGCLDGIQGSQGRF